MDSSRWFFLVLLIVFIAISWGVRAFLSQRTTDKVAKKESDEAKK
ncbi:MAG: hypothetical protein ACYCXI_04440 [Dethiobacteraceae bacterium]|mgnify:CR=1 FL=1